MLQQQGKLQSDRIIKFANLNDIEKVKDILKTYVLGTVVIEKSGKKIAFRKNPELIPDELLKAFEEDPAFKKSFYTLTAGRQRGYVIYFSQSRKPQTRIGRIEKCKPQIFDGIGLNDKYSY